MIIERIWLTKLILAHLLTDFILQPKSWVDDRNKKHNLSRKLYVHGAVTGFVALMMIGWHHWLVALIILITHTVIDGWKSYQKQTAAYFLVDQVFHIVIILLCWYFTFIKWSQVLLTWNQLNKDLQIWKILTAFIFLTAPAGILIGQFTKQWREKILDNNTNTESLANAGKWIGIVERIVILIFILQNQYAAIGLLVAAKGIIRFNEKDRPEVKTEYLVTGTLLSLGITVVTGILIKL